MACGCSCSLADVKHQPCVGVDTERVTLGSQSKCGIRNTAQSPGNDASWYPERPHLRKYLLLPDDAWLNAMTTGGQLHAVSPIWGVSSPWLFPFHRRHAPDNLVFSNFRWILPWWTVFSRLVREECGKRLSGAEPALPAFSLTKLGSDADVLPEACSQQAAGIYPLGGVSAWHVCKPSKKVLPTPGVTLKNKVFLDRIVTRTLSENIFSARK